VRRRPSSPESRIEAAASGPALVAHIDGGARGNPGPAGYGVHIEAESDERPGGGGSDRPLAELFGYLGIATNNTAEYAALLALLEFAKSSGARSLRILSDSELLVRQMRGEYRVKDPKLKVLVAAARALAAALPRVVLEHVPREENREADALANRAMDTRESSGTLPAALRDLPRTPTQTRLM
jgi:ribonuclease HI